MQPFERDEPTHALEQARLLDAPIHELTKDSSVYETPLLFEIDEVVIRKHAELADGILELAHPVTRYLVGGVLQRIAESARKHVSQLYTWVV